MKVRPIEPRDDMPGEIVISLTREFVAVENDLFREVGTGELFTLDGVLDERRYSSGPCRVQQVENWSRYDFEGMEF